MDPSLIHVPPPDPGSTWNLDRTEEYYTMSDLNVNGPVSHVEPGTPLLVTGRLKRHWCHVMRNGYGHEERWNHTEEDASATPLRASLVQGDGVLSALEASGSGQFSVQFVMGSQTNSIRVELPGAYPACQFDLAITPPPPPPQIIDYVYTGDQTTPPPLPLPESFEFSHTERTVRVDVSTSSDAIVENQSVDILVQALETSWDVWVGNQGNVDLRNHRHGPAMGVPVSLTCTLGAAWFLSPSGYTDATGVWRTPASLTAGRVEVTADVSCEGVAGSGNLYRNVSSPPPSEPAPPSNDPSSSSSDPATSTNDSTSSSTDSGSSSTDPGSWTNDPPSNVTEPPTVWWMTSSSSTDLKMNAVAAQPGVLSLDLQWHEGLEFPRFSGHGSPDKRTS